MAGDAAIRLHAIREREASAAHWLIHVPPDRPGAAPPHTHRGHESAARIVERISLSLPFHHRTFLAERDGQERPSDKPIVI